MFKEEEIHQEKDEGSNDKQLTDKEKELIVEKRFQTLLQTPRLQKVASRRKVINAYEMAKDAHAKQVRKGGLKLPYISHPIAVARIVAEEMGFGSTTIAAALLHDVVEDSKYSLENIREQFGDDIALIVDGLTKITNVPDAGRTGQAATFQKLILKMSQDKRVAFVKIADRLHNLRTMDDMPINNIMIKTAEALAVYAPLAFKLGLVNIRKEIEDISFRLREPDEYRRMDQIVSQNAKALEDATGEFCKNLYDSMEKDGFKYRIEPVRKSLFRLREELKNKKLRFDQLINFQSERIVFTPYEGKSVNEQCFDIYCKVAEIYKVRPESLRDWITNARSNGFQALVFEVFYGDYWKEIQIMTEAMNEIAQRGYAKNHDNLHVRQIESWVNTTEQALNKGELSNDDLIDIVSTDVSEIIVITPKGEMVPLARNSTVLDFAFKVHSELGLRFLSAEVNKKIVKPDYVLQNGDMVKIIDSDAAKPDSSWLKYLTSAGNRAQLKEYLSGKKADKIDLGKALFKKIDEMYRLEPEHMEQILHAMGADDMEDLHYKLGKKYIIPEDIEKLLKMDRGSFFSGLGKFIKKKNIPEKEKKITISDKKTPHTIRSLEEISLATCCRPIPGDEAMVYIDSSHHMIVHKRSCPNAKKLNSADGKKTRAVVWDLITDENAPAAIEFTGVDRKGLLADMLKIIHDDLQVNMKDLNIHAENNTFKGTIDFWISDSNVLDFIVNKLRKVSGISEVHRR